MSLLCGFDPEFEYGEECYTYLMERERKRFMFCKRSPELEYREDLIRRIKVLCICHKLSLRVRYLSIYILDFFMDNHHIVDTKLELTVVCSLIIAAKVDESDTNIPKYSQLFSDSNQYSLEEVFEMESNILTFFDWIFLTPTAATYIDYLYAKCLDVKETNSDKVIIEKYLDKTIDPLFYKFYPSQIASSVIYCTRVKLKLKPIWPKYIQHITKYSFTQIKECVYELTKYETLPLPTKGTNGLLNDSGFVEFEQIF